MRVNKRDAPFQFHLIIKFNKLHSITTRFKHLSLVQLNRLSSVLVNYSDWLSYSYVWCTECFWRNDMLFDQYLRKKLIKLIEKSTHLDTHVDVIQTVLGQTTSKVLFVWAWIALNKCRRYGRRLFQRL